MSSSVLRPYNGRVEKYGGADGVAREAEDIEKRKVWCEAMRCSPLDVQYDLWVK